MKALQAWIKGTALVIILGIIIFSQSCEEPDLIGLETQPLQDKLGLNICDTTTVTAYTFSEDSVVSDELTVNLLGHYYDPVFGTTRAAFFFQPRLSSNNVDFGTSPVADSIVLSMVYDGYYGNENSTFLISVYEANSTYEFDSTYYSNQDIDFKPTKIFEGTVAPNMDDSVKIDGEMTAPQMRLKLTQAFADQFINASPSNLADNDAFLDFFKGIYITAEAQSNGSILYFDLANSLSKITLYYHNSTDTTTFSFVINENSTTINTYSHNNYADASAANLINQLNGDTSFGEDNLYIQAMAGTRVKLYFPHLRNWAKNQRIAINKAVLVLPVDGSVSSTDTYEPPSQLGLVKLDEDGDANFLDDYFLGAAYFGGAYNKSRKAYEFNVAKHIQDLIDGNETDYGLNLLANLRQITANRVVLNGTKGSERIKLEITYTLLD